MKKLLLVLSVLLITTVMVTGGCLDRGITKPETPTRIIENVTPQEASTLIQDNQNNPDFIILDVRTPEEFTDGHIESAINLDFYSETFRDKLDSMDKNQTYLIYCRSGNRSGKALSIMTELNFREVYNISDGIIGWQAAELPTVK